MNLSEIRTVDQLRELLESDPDVSNIDYKLKRQILKIRGIETQLDRLIELGFTMSEDDFKKIDPSFSIEVLRKFFPDDNDILDHAKYLKSEDLRNLLFDISYGEIAPEPHHLRDLFLDTIEDDNAELFIRLDKKYNFVVEDNYKDGESYINVYIRKYYDENLEGLEIINYLIDNYNSICNMPLLLALTICKRDIEIVKIALNFTNEIDASIDDMDYPDEEIMNLVFEKIDGYQVTMFYIKCIMKPSNEESFIGLETIHNLYKHAVNYLSMEEIGDMIKKFKKQM